MKEDLFGLSYDLEHQNRSGNESPPARIINPYQLQSYGIYLHEINQIHALMRGIIHQSHKCDVLQGWCGMQQHNFKTASKEEMWTPHGRIFFMIDISPGKPVKIKKTISDYLPDGKIHSKIDKTFYNCFYIVFHHIIEAYCTEIFPFYLHFIVKDSKIHPMPVPYMEILISSEKKTKGNLLGDFNYLDCKSGITKKPWKQII